MMDEVRKPDGTETLPNLGVSIAQASSDVTRRFCEQGHSVAKTMDEWNSEVSQFLTHRVARNGEAMGRLTKCQNLPDAFAIQTQWVQDATDDYLKEMSRLIEINSKIMSGLLLSRAN